MIRGYDQWKTRSPDDESDYDYEPTRDPDELERELVASVERIVAGYERRLRRERFITGGIGVALLAVIAFLIAGCQMPLR